MRRIRFFVEIFFAFVVFQYVLFAVPAGAEAASMTLYPKTGYALIAKPFAVDVMLDTGGKDVTEARAVFRFDPKKVQVTKAEYGELFCQYPEDEYAVDNDAGWIKLTGYCNDPYYNSNGMPGLLGRFTFEPKVEGTVDFDFVKDYDDENWVSRIMNTSSPPQEISGVQYENASYTLVANITQNNNGTEGKGGKLPVVGLFDNWIVFGGAALFMGGMTAIFIQRMSSFFERRKKLRDSTIIV